jgi:hypothetical protein
MSSVDVILSLLYVAVGGFCGVAVFALLNAVLRPSGRKIVALRIVSAVLSTGPVFAFFWQDFVHVPAGGEQTVVLPLPVLLAGIPATIFGAGLGQRTRRQ